MRYGIVINAGDPRQMADLAGEAEAAGWDGVFYYDAIAIGDAELYDPWVVLGAMALRTGRVTLGLIVAAPSRRRPWKLAREAMTVDRLSHGRLVLPVGLGALEDEGYGNVGEVTDSKARAERLDETLAILDGLWLGEPFGFDGRHFRFGPMTFRPTPVQRPRIPIWVVGVWGKERTMQRVLRWDGIVTQTTDVDEIRAIADYVERERRSLTELRSRPFDIIVQGEAKLTNLAQARKEAKTFADAGATWWIDADWNLKGGTELLRKRIAAGPPSPLHGPRQAGGAGG
jgi:alkanesulfonate monooxygenase SsuD/methylene tetrahydromethanopterin reductase-like flavin-dependent oxidoreductase (luciferase family)